jgi:hypothetical protein
MGTIFKVDITPKYKTVCSDGDFIWEQKLLYQYFSLQLVQAMEMVAEIKKRIIQGTDNSIETLMIIRQNK